MSLFFKTATKTFSLLSIGQRGVGKTVFLAGSYAEAHSPAQTGSAEQLWVDCQDRLAQENIEDILNYIGKTNQYPPPTMKITNFDFSLKRHTKWGDQTLCNFRWWDIPGESCNIKNPDFCRMVLNSHGCCVFIDAYALIHKPTYSQDLEETLEAVMAIASLVYMNSLKFPFALILTKCDLLEPSLMSQQHFQESLQPLTSWLDSMKASYQTFYSNIPIVSKAGSATLKAKGAAAPLLWLVLKLIKVYKLGFINNPSELIASLLPVPSRSQRQQDQVEGTLEHLLKPTDKTSRFKKILGVYLSPSDIHNLLRLALLFSVLIGSIGLLGNYERIFQRESNLDAIAQAVATAEKLVEKEPDSINLRLQLAQIYETTGQLGKAETVYEQVLRRQKDNLQALVSKALLRHTQGDPKTAKALFVQAEKAASTKSQAEKVRAIAHQTLRSSVK